jgi:hypothetical protein
LHKYSWLGKDLAEPDSTGRTIIYNWLGLTAPSFNEYFAQMQAVTNVPGYRPNFILCIDSLTLKFEAIFRDFARRSGVSTTVSGKGGILREMYMEEVFQEKAFKQRFDEDDRMLFEYLFTSKYGLQLRNNIAPGFYKFSNYTIHHMHLLMLAFLRIGKYQLKKVNS